MSIRHPRAVVVTDDELMVLSEAPLVRPLVLLLPLLILGCSGITDPPVVGGPSGVTPLMDMVPGDTYLGFAGGLYPDGTARMPASHDSAGRQAARLIRPLDANGNPAGAGKIVLMSVGMSIPTMEWCQGADVTSCQLPESFMVRAWNDPTIRNGAPELVDGANGKQTIPFWDQASDVQYGWVTSQRLTPRGLTEKQVQAIWMKVVNSDPTVSLPAANADAYSIVTGYGNILRALRVHYPNLRVVFLSSRSYAGYATGTTDPEPYAYEHGFAVKWVVEAQIRQRDAGVIDLRAGDLGPAVTPWIGWGPDLWANGATPRRDGLSWVPADFLRDGLHPAAPGVVKVVSRLLPFFKTSPQSRCWFLAAQPPC